MHIAGLKWEVRVPQPTKRAKSDTSYWGRVASSPDNKNLFITPQGWPTDRGWAKGYFLHHKFGRGAATVSRAYGGGYALIVTTGPFRSTTHTSPNLSTLLHGAPVLIARHCLVHMD